MATSTQTPRVPSTRGGRFLGFLAVGATGLVVNQLAFWVLTDVFGLYYLWGVPPRDAVLDGVELRAPRAVRVRRPPGGPVGAPGLVRPDEQHLERRERAGDVRDHDRVRRAAPVGELVRDLRDDGRALRDLEPVDLAGARHRDRPGGHGADAAAEHLVLRHPRHRADRVRDAAARARAVRGAGVAGRARHRGDGQQPRVRRAPPQGERHRSRRPHHLHRAPRPVRVRREDRRRDPFEDPGVQAAPSLAARRVHQRGGARGPVGHGAQGLHPRPRRLPADRRSRRADHGAHRHGQDHHVL